MTTSKNSGGNGFDRVIVFDDADIDRVLKTSGNEREKYFASFYGKTERTDTGRNTHDTRNAREHGQRRYNTVGRRRFSCPSTTLSSPHQHHRR